MNFWIAIEGVLGCSTEHGDATCSIPPGATFIVDTYLDPLPSNFPAYGAFDVSLSYSGVIPNHDADTSAWPDCGFPASYYEPGLVQFGCAVGINAPGSTFSGLIGTSSFVCAESGNISLVHGRGSTDLVNL